MAHYSTSVRTPLAPDAAFAYMADLRNLARWDPGVSASERVRGDHPGLGTAYDVTVTSGLETTLRYEVVEYEAPRRVRVVAKTRSLVSIDEVRVEPATDAKGNPRGSVVTYDAKLSLTGPLRVFDRALQVFFQRIGDRAAAGLRRALLQRAAEAA